MASCALFQSCRAALESPIVGYSIKKEILEEFGGSNLDLPTETIMDDLIKLPYHHVATWHESCPESLCVLSIEQYNGERFLVCANIDRGFYMSVPLSMTFGEFIHRTNDPKTMLLDKFTLSIILYITHGKDKNEEKCKITSYQRAKSKNNYVTIKGIVGGNFAIKMNQWKKDQYIPHGGTHSSPIPHLRRGHWHKYRTGVGRSSSRIIFVHPCLINATCIDKDTEIHGVFS